MRPDVILISVDQWRGDVLGHMGNPAAVTPNLDAWVDRDAVSFRNAFCQSPVCTPSRCSFMTGWYPHVRGHRTMHHMLRPEEPMLLRTLKQAGYHVWWGGRNDVVPADADFDVYCDHHSDVPESEEPVRPMFAIDREAEWRGEPGSDAYYSFYVGTLGSERYHDKDWARVEGAVDFIREWDGDQPLCLYVALTYPHPPYAVEEPWFGTIDRDALPPRLLPGEGEPSIMSGIRKRQGLDGWSEARWDELRATYYGMCARVDHQVGLLLAALRDGGLYDDALVMLFSDHGDFTGDYGLVEKAQNAFPDALMRVPLIVKPPAGTPLRPGVVDALVELVDVPATVEAITGVAPPHHHFGRSLLPLVGGEAFSPRDAVFAEGGRLRGEHQAMELESADSQTPAGLYWPRLSLQAESAERHTKAAMCRTADTKYVRRLYERDELYDLRADPGEQRNVIDDPAYARLRAELTDRLLRWYQETCDVVPLIADKRE